MFIKVSMSEQSNLSIGHSPGDEPGKTKTVNAESSNSWYVNMNNGNVNTNNKTNAGRVRPVSAIDSMTYPYLQLLKHTMTVAGKSAILATALSFLSIMTQS